MNQKIIKEDTMSLIKFRKTQPDIWNDVFSWEHPLWGLAVFPLMAEAGKRNRLFLPAFDVTEKADSVNIKADVPGLKKEDLQVYLDRNVLTVRGKRTQEQQKEGECQSVERFYGSFERRVVLDADVEASGVTATYKNGVLEIVLPKTRKATAQRIGIKQG